jgi:hypothetical protein
MRYTGRPASPQQIRHGFHEGQGTKGEELNTPILPRFSRGQEKEPARTAEIKPRFSRGQESQDSSPEKMIERTFAEGLAQRLPDQ